MKVLVLNGPNLNLLGDREINIYGEVTLDEINTRLKRLAGNLGVSLETYQSNHEGELIDKLHRAVRDGFSAVIFNPGAFTHYSLALRDAVTAINIPVVEVHLSNIYAREEFRRHSVIAPVAAGQISGFGISSYFLALRAVVEMETCNG